MSNSCAGGNWIVFPGLDGTALLELPIIFEYQAMTNAFVSERAAMSGKSLTKSCENEKSSL